MSIIINGNGHNSNITLYKIHQGLGSFRQDTATYHSQVELIQEKLTQLGYNTQGADGKFGTNTLAAVKSFQRNNGLTQDGYFGRNSLNKLEDLLNVSHISSDCTVEGEIILNGVSSNPGTPDPDDPDENQEGYRYGKVNVSTVNIRQTAGGEYLGVWPRNRIGIVKSYNSTWYQTFWNGNTAYVMKQYLDDVGAASTDKIQRMKTIAFNEIGRTDPNYFYSFTGAKWCQYFANWLAKHAGFASNQVPNTASTPAAVEWYVARNKFWFTNAANKSRMRQYGSVASYTTDGLTANELNFRPQAGDFVFFRWANSTSDHCSHVGFVDSYNSETGVIHTIEGNKGDAVGTRDIVYNHSEIVGYGRLI